MSYQLLIRPEAEADLADARQWYEAQRAGLGDDLLLAIDAGLAMIERLPEAFPVVHRDVRRFLVRRFPYAIFYIVRDQTIVVLAVMHAHRDPRRWQERR